MAPLTGGISVIGGLLFAKSAERVSRLNDATRRMIEQNTKIAATGLEELSEIKSLLLADDLTDANERWSSYTTPTFKKVMQYGALRPSWNVIDED